MIELSRGLTADDAGRSQSFLLTGICKRNEMVGVCAAKTDQSFSTLIYRSFQVIFKLKPLIAGDLRMNKVEPHYISMCLIIIDQA